jgi:hypothetical protein
VCPHHVCSKNAIILILIFSDLVPCASTATTLEMHQSTFCRHIDLFCKHVSVVLSQNNNDEIRERDGFPTFPHGVTHFVISKKRIDGGWHVSIARHFRIFLFTTSLLRNKTKKCFVRRTIYYSKSTYLCVFLCTKKTKYTASLIPIMHC